MCMNKCIPCVAVYATPVSYSDRAIYFAARRKSVNKVQHHNPHFKLGVLPIRFEPRLSRDSFPSLEGQGSNRENTQAPS